MTREAEHCYVGRDPVCGCIRFVVSIHPWEPGDASFVARRVSEAERGGLEVGVATIDAFRAEGMGTCARHFERPARRPAFGQVAR